MLSLASPENAGRIWWKPPDTWGAAGQMALNFSCSMCGGHRSGAGIPGGKGTGSHFGGIHPNIRRLFVRSPSKDGHPSPDRRWVINELCWPLPGAPIKSWSSMQSKLHSSAIRSSRGADGQTIPKPCPTIIIPTNLSIITQYEGGIPNDKN